MTLLWSIFKSFGPNWQLKWNVKPCERPHLKYFIMQQGSQGGCFWMLLFILLAAHQHVCFVYSVLFESSVVCSYSSCYSPESGFTISENDVKAKF